MEYRANELEAKNQDALGRSIDTLSAIDKNISKVGQILGRSQTMDRLTQQQPRKEKPFRDQVGRRITLGTGKDQVAAKD